MFGTAINARLLRVIVTICVLSISSTNALISATQIVDGESDGVKYFPGNAFDRNLEASESLAHACAVYLSAMDEPSLLDAAQENSGEQFRLFRFAPLGQQLSLRLNVRQSGSGVMLKKIATDRAHIEKEAISITPSQIATLTTQLRESGFWNESAVPRGDDRKDSGVWVLEWVQGKKYRIVVFRDAEARKWKSVINSWTKLGNISEDHLGADNGAFQ